MNNDTINWAEIEALKDRLGMTWARLAQFTYVDVSTLRNWRKPGAPRHRPTEILFLRRIEQLKRRSTAP